MNIFADIRHRWKHAGYALNRFIIKHHRTFEVLAKVFGGASFVASAVCIVAGTLYIGFEHTHGELRLLARLIRVAQWVFITKILYDIIFNFRERRRQARVLMWIADIGILLTLPPLLYTHPEHPWIPWLADVLYDNRVVWSLVGLYAVVEFCFGIQQLLDRRLNPSLMLATSFLFFILIGSFLLMMPRCTLQPISYIDSLFVSTSAVCITGLTSVDVSQTFTPFGLLVLGLMVQIGGLGVMTFTSFFALFFSGNNSIYSQVMVKDMIQSKTMNALLPTLLYILGFTLAVEAIGAVGIFLSVHGTLGMSVTDELIFSAFHALSAFCNAGFSNIEGGMANPALLHSNQIVYLVASALIFMGGIGFPILVNFKSAFAGHLRRIWNAIVHHGRRRRAEPAHLYDMNTKIVMYTTLVLFAVTAIAFFFSEYNNTLAGMSLYDKVVQSIFNAFVPRSSGFSSLPTASMMPFTILLMMVMMWIGGGSQSTAGGIKVNTFAVIILELRSLVTGRPAVVAFHRTISHDSIRRAFAVVTLSILAYCLFAMALVLLEPAMSVEALLFEAASALFTVGSSFGITPDLTDGSKVLLCGAMFLGRVGLISMLMGLVRRAKASQVRYPVDNVIIN